MVVGIAWERSVVTASPVRVFPKFICPVKTPNIPLSQIKYRAGGGTFKFKFLVNEAIVALALGSKLPRSPSSGSPETAAKL